MDIWNLEAPLYTGEVEAGGAAGVEVPTGLTEDGAGGANGVEEAGAGAGLEPGLTPLGPGKVVGTTQPSVQVTTDVTVRVLVWVTGVLMTDEPLVIVVQVTGGISNMIAS